MESEADIEARIQLKLREKKDVKDVKIGSVGPDIVVTSSDGRKLIIEVKAYSAPDALDVARVSNWQKQQKADAAIIASGSNAWPSAVEAATKLNVSIMTPYELLRNIESQPLQFLYQPAAPARATSTTTKTYDVFISYSSEEKPIAERIAERLRSDGFQVWYDEWEVLVGHDIVDKVYDGIRNSRFLLVLLSEKSVVSNWVQQEINAARIREIESGATVVLPAIVTSGAKPLIPESLKTKRYADIAGNFESAIQEIEYAVSVTKMTLPFAQPPKEDLTINMNNLLDTASSDLTSYGWKMNEAYRQVIVTPNHPIPKIPRKDLEKIVDSCTIEINGYGGPLFPYRLNYPSVTMIHHADGFGILDNREWPYEDWSFHYWYFNELGYFITRRHLSEEHMMNIPRGTLALEWLELDIARSVMFAQKLLATIRDYSEARVEFQLHGMKNRQLIILNKSRSGFVADYVSSDDDIDSEAILTSDTDLIQTGMDMLLGITWRFGWGNPSEEVLRKDMSTLVSGRFPR